MEKTTWSKAPPALRSELQTVLAGENAAFHSDLTAVMQWRLFVLFASLGAAVICCWLLMGSAPAPDLLLSELGATTVQGPADLIAHPWSLALLVALGALAWAAHTWIPAPGRYGLVLTQPALVVVRGRRLSVLPWDQVVSAVRTPSHGGRRHVVLTLTTKPGRVHRFAATGPWVDQALRRLADPQTHEEGPASGRSLP